MKFYSTNNKLKKVTFKQALLEGQSYPDYGLFMIAREDVPKLSSEQIKAMKNKSYAEIAFDVLSSYLVPEIPEEDLKRILDDAYSSYVIPSSNDNWDEESRGSKANSAGRFDKSKLPRDFSVVSISQNDKNKQDISPKIQHVADNTYIMWLTKGPTYSFKDYAARFFGRVLNYFLKKDNKRKVVITATSGDTGGAVADALLGLENVDNIVFYPKDFISERQRRQMTTLGRNIYAFAVNGDFDVCQALAKRLLGDKDFAQELFKDKDIFTSANSISLGRLLPQAVYPFYAYSKIFSDVIPRGGSEVATRELRESLTLPRDSSSSITPQNDRLFSIIASIPSGNFGDMLGTVLAKEMGLPISKIICGVNENTEFPEFLESGKYQVRPTKQSPSSAMMVSHPSNLARLIDFYGGHMFDERDANGQIVKRGVIDKMPNLSEMRKDIFSASVNNEEHYQTIKEVYEKYKIILDPHGAVGWKALDKFLKGEYNKKLNFSVVQRFEKSSVLFNVIYETADPAKFPEDIEKAIGIIPEIPEGIKRQATLKERVYQINSESDVIDGSQTLNESQYNEAKEILRDIFK